METITCRCGAFISTNDSDPSYRADLLPEIHEGSLEAAQLTQLRALAEALRAGKSFAEFLEIPDSNSALVVEALLLWKLSGEPFFDLSRQVLQCRTCGRLLVETSQPNNFRTFLPESDDSHCILGA